MKYIASLLLAQLAGNENPSAADIAKILGSVGIESDNARLEALLKEVSGKSVSEVGLATKEHGAETFIAH